MVHQWNPLAFHSLGQINRAIGSPGIDNYLRFYSQYVPVVGDLARVYDSNKSARDYMKNRNIDWNNVLYPTRLGSGGGSLSKPMEVSWDAVDKLYNGDRQQEMYDLRKRAYENSIEANNYRKAWYYSRM